jgi:hypothetical protein
MADLAHSKNCTVDQLHGCTATHCGALLRLVALAGVAAISIHVPEQPLASQNLLIAGLFALVNYPTCSRGIMAGSRAAPHLAKSVVVAPF